MKYQDINKQVGENIKIFRKKKSLTLLALSNLLYKSKATLSKYERGEIAIDIATLHRIADVLDVHLIQLIGTQPPKIRNTPLSHPAFFSNSTTFYSYLYDGRANNVIRSRFDVVETDDPNQNNIYMYMNFKDYDNYQNCENTYYGNIEHFDAVTNIVMRNKDTAIERINICILASFLDSNTKWGLFSGLSSRPMMPIAVRMLFSKTILQESDEFVQSLKVSKEDIRLLKYYNMYPVT